MQFNYLITQSHLAGWYCSNAVGLHSGDVRFRCRQVHRLLWVRFSWTLSNPLQNSGLVPGSGCGPSVPNSIRSPAPVLTAVSTKANIYHSLEKSFHPEEGDIRSLRNVGNLYQATRRHMPNDRNLYSNIIPQSIWVSAWFPFWYISTNILCVSHLPMYATCSGQISLHSV
jgi:hypothetical protein